MIAHRWILEDDESLYTEEHDPDEINPPEPPGLAPRGEHNHVSDLEDVVDQVPDTEYWNVLFIYLFIYSFIYLHNLLSNIQLI